MQYSRTEPRKWPSQSQAHLQIRNHFMVCEKSPSQFATLTAEPHTIPCLSQLKRLYWLVLFLANLQTCFPFTSPPLISYAKVMHFITEIRKICIKSCLLQNSVDSPPAGIYYLIKNVVVPAAMQHVSQLWFQVELKLNPYWKWSLAWISLFSILMHTWKKKKALKKPTNLAFLDLAT